ncbi:GvpL/GvpF family gas vesicle protein, partial [Streptomyces sp. SYSU K21746]
MTDTSRYVYAIIRTAGPLPTDTVGVGSPPAALRVIRQGPVAAVVSDVPPKLRARRRDLLAHQALLMRLAEDGPVLPMRFGVVAPDERSVSEQLTASRLRYLAALEQLDGRVELNVKALPAQNALAALVAQDKDVRRLREEVHRQPGYHCRRTALAPQLCTDERPQTSGHFGLSL